MEVLGEGQPDLKEMQDKVVKYFCERSLNFPEGRPYNCCESIILVLSEWFGIKLELIPKIGTAIGAGVSLNGFLCGSISGVAMMIGIKYGRTRIEESPKQAWEIMDEYLPNLKKYSGV